MCGHRYATPMKHSESPEKWKTEQLLVVTVDVVEIFLTLTSDCETCKNHMSEAMCVIKAGKKKTSPTPRKRTERPSTTHPVSKVFASTSLGGSFTTSSALRPMEGGTSDGCDDSQTNSGLAKLLSSPSHIPGETCSKLGTF